MFKVLNINDNEWDNCVESFKKTDIYYDRSYYKALEKYLGVKIVLLYYENGDAKICEVVQINDISKFEPLSQHIKPHTWFDLETPYGYGGPLTENADEIELNNYFELKQEWAKQHNIVSEFIRYNPLEQNQVYTNNNLIQINAKSTIYINLESEQQILHDMDSKNRNMVRKAIKNGVVVKMADESNISEIITKFKQLYKSTMDRNNASDFYYFNDEYFNNFFKDMHGKYKIFYAEYNGEIVATSIFIFNNTNIHYYLSGANREFLNLAPNNLLLFEVAKWGAENGFEKFHLGGGVQNNDALFGFKKQFNTKGELPFYIGRQIYNQQQFQNLIQVRADNEKGFDLNKKFLIKYRQEVENEQENIYNSRSGRQS